MSPVTAIAAAQWIALESEDYDGMGGAKGYGWARASTDDVARGIGVSSPEAYRLLVFAAKAKLVIHVKSGRKPLHGRQGMTREQEVGWALWEVHLTREQTIARVGSARAPDERAIAFHAKDWEREHAELTAASCQRGDRVSGSELVDACAVFGISLDKADQRKMAKPGMWVQRRASSIENAPAHASAIAAYEALARGI